MNRFLISIAFCNYRAEHDSISYCDTEKETASGIIIQEQSCHLDSLNAKVRMNQ